MNRTRAVNLGLLVMVLFVAAVGASSIPVSNDLPLQTDDGFTVVLDDVGIFPGLGVFVGDDTISIDTGEVSHTGTGQLTIADSDLSGDTVLTGIEVSSATAEVNPDDKPQFDLSGDVTAFTLKASLAEDDGSADISYTSTGNFDLTLRSLSPNTDYIFETSGGTVLGVGDTDGSGTMTITLDEVGTFDGELRTNDPPVLSNLSPDGVTVSEATQTLSVDVDDTSFCCASGDEVDVEFFDASDDSQIGSDQTITEASTVTQSVTLTTNGPFSWYVVATDKYGASTQSPDQTFTLAEPAPTLVDFAPEDGALISEGPVDIEVEVADANLGSGDSVDVTFFDGEGDTIGSTQTLTSNGTASVTYGSLVGGENQWSATVSDSFGNQLNTSTFSFQIPDELTLRDVSDPTNIIDEAGVDATVRFYEEGDDDVYPRSPTNGVIDMQGLPVNQPFVVGVRDDSNTYISRLTLIDTIFEQQSVYLINSTLDTAIIQFTIEDRTGQFAGSGTKLQIRRAIDTTTSPADQEEYVIVAGDVVGAQLQFETELEQDVRYRVRIENEQGETRQLGAFTARVDQVIGLTISGIDVGVDIPEDEPVIETSLDESNPNTTTAQFAYVDLAQETTSLQLEVLQAGNTSNVLDTAEISGPPNIKTFQHTTTLTGDEAEYKLLYDVEYVRNGQTFEVRKAYGLNQYPIGLPLSGPWKSIFSVGFLIVLAGVFSVRNARIGAIIIPGVAALLYSIGFLTGVATILGIALAMVLAIGYNLAFAGRGAIR